MSSNVAAFNINHYQFLDPSGQLIGANQPAIARDFDRLTEFYELMTLTRTFDKKAIALQRTGKLGTYASCLGHEAAQVAIGATMREEDCFAPMYREYGAQLYRGVKMSEILAYWGGDERGNDFSGPKHDFAWCVPIATQCLHAAGAAMAFKLRNEQRAAVSVVGDGGSSKGDFLEAINAASAWKLPLVLIIMNNQWAISVPRSKQNSAQTLAQKGIAGGLPSIQVDGNDLIACHWAMEKALERARSGQGASVIEMVTYRLSDHTTADDARRYRDNEEVDKAWEREPLKRLRAWLEASDAWNEDKQQALEADCVNRVNEAVEEYLALGYPGNEGMFDYMFAQLPHDLQAQREQALRELPAQPEGHH